LCQTEDVNIISRNNKHFNEKFYSIHQTLKEFHYNAIFDGETCVLKETGVTSFNAFQNGGEKPTVN